MSMNTLFFRFVREIDEADCWSVFDYCGATLANIQVICFSIVQICKKVGD